MHLIDVHQNVLFQMVKNRWRGLGNLDIQVILQQGIIKNLSVKLLVVLTYVHRHKLAVCIDE